MSLEQRVTTLEKEMTDLKRQLEGQSKLKQMSEEEKEKRFEKIQAEAIENFSKRIEILLNNQPTVSSLIKTPIASK